MGQWFIYQRGAPPSGPLSSLQLRQQIDEGTVAPDALVCSTDGGEWQPAAELRVSLNGVSDRPWFLFREGRSPLGPLSDDLLQRGIEAGRVPPDTLVCRAGDAAWSPLAKALPEAVGAEPADPRQEKTALRSAVRPPDEALGRARLVLAVFCAVPLVIVLLALLARR